MNSSDTATTNDHTNAFVNLDGVPYILDEYIEQGNFQQIDRALVKDDITADTSEERTTILDISIDDIGKTSDGSINIIGNSTKQASLVEMIKSGIYQLEHHLPVLKNGIVVQVNYRLENKRTGQILRSMQEQLRIDERNYFVDINAKNINDTAIIANFSDSMVSTVAEFTHGTDPLMFRITSIQLIYECVRPPKFRPFPGRPPLYKMPPEAFIHDGLHDEQEMYYYHKSLQQRGFAGEPYPNPMDPIPKQWHDFNRFYHFSEDGKDIILHDDEINSKKTRILPIICGNITVNRTFIANPGQRIVFRFSIWKNDITIVSDTSEIAKALRIQTAPYIPPKPDDNKKDESNDEDENKYPPCPPYPPPYYDPYDLLHIMNILQQNMSGADLKQNEAINKLNSELKEIADIIKKNHEDSDVPSIEDTGLPTKGDKPPKPPKPPITNKGVKVIIEMLKDLQDQINNINSGSEGGTPITDQKIQELLDALEADYDDDQEYNGSTKYPPTDENGSDNTDNDSDKDSSDNSSDNKKETPVSAEPTTEEEPSESESSNASEQSTKKSASVSRSAADMIG